MAGGAYLWERGLRTDDERLRGYGPTVDDIIITLEDDIHTSPMRAFPEYKDVDRLELAECVLDLRRALTRCSWIDGR